MSGVFNRPHVSTRLFAFMVEPSNIVISYYIFSFHLTRIQFAIREDCPEGLLRLRWRCFWMSVFWSYCTSGLQCCYSPFLKCNWTRNEISVNCFSGIGGYVVFRTYYCRLKQFLESTIKWFLVMFFSEELETIITYRTSSFSVTFQL